MWVKINKMLHFIFKLRKKIFLPILILYLIVAAFGAHYIEPQTFDSFLTSLYWVFTTLATVGFGDYAPKTALGKSYTIVLYITGIALVSAFIGSIIRSVRLFEELKVGGKLKYTGKNHIILIGWNDKSKLAIKEILTSDAKTDIVLIDTMEQLPMGHERLFFLQGNPAEEAVLLNANLSEAKGVIIFADQNSQEHYAIKDSLLIDGKTLLVATAITSIEERLKLNIHITAEVINQEHIRLFDHVKVDEFIPTQEMISHAAVRSIFSHGVTHMYSEMMGTGFGEDMYQIPKNAKWKTYRDAFFDLLNVGATLVADRGDLHINQKLDEFIPEDAELFVICDKTTLAKIKP